MATNDELSDNRDRQVTGRRCGPAAAGADMTREADDRPAPAGRRAGKGFLLVAPGILVAATGVGAGDLLTASLGGANAGLAILWAAWLGAVLKWFLNEGIARWQMATGTTLLAGWVSRLGQLVQWVFLAYLLLWSVFVAGALVNACGVAGTGLLPLGEDLATSKILWGIFHSLLGLLLVRLGGFRVFEYVMGACVGLMFLSVVATTVLLGPDWAAVGRGMLVPTLPAGATGWVLGVLGGVGGTVTLLSYGYWIREQERTGRRGWRLCRLDLALGYGMTAVFGLCMIVIGSHLTLERGPLLALELAEKIAAALGPWGVTGQWVFLVGFWGAVFSSLLGVWQSVPYLYADFARLRRHTRTGPEAPGEMADVELAATPAYGRFLWFLALAALPWLWGTVWQIQLLYAVFGAFFMPLLALTLLVMNNRRDWVTAEFRNGWLTNLFLGFILLLFAWIGLREVVPILQSVFH